jgi:hypothetical protein
MPVTTATIALEDERPLPATPARQTVGVLRLAAGLLVLAAIITQIVDQLVHDAFVPGEYFSYFTIDSSMMNVVVLLAGGLLAFRLKRDTVLYTGVRMATLVYAVVTAAVYNVLLRGVPSDGFHGIQWPNEVEHVWIPIYLVIDWLFATGRARLGWRWLWAAVGFPIAWCVFTLLRGAVTGWYPYPFIDPATGGWVSVLIYVVALSAFIVGIAALAVAYSRWRLRPRDE